MLLITLQITIYDTIEKVNIFPLKSALFFFAEHEAMILLTRKNILTRCAINFLWQIYNVLFITIKAQRH